MENTAVQKNGFGNNHKKSQAQLESEQNLELYVFGKMQPQAIALEEAVLGAILVDKECVHIASDLLVEESFYKQQHQPIYRAILALYKSNLPVDLLTVTEWLKKASLLEAVGGGYVLVELTHRVASSANMEYHCRIIAQKYIQRQMIKVAQKTLQDAYEDTEDCFTMLESFQKGVFDIDQGATNQQNHIGALALEAYNTAAMAKESGGGLVGVPSGFYDVDKLTGGWRNTDLILLAARPGMGKSALLSAFAVNASKDFGKKVLLFSLEMSGTQLALRIMSEQSSLDSMKLNQGTATDEEFYALQGPVETLQNMPLWIDETPSQTVYQMRSICRRHKRLHGLDLIGIDFLQLATDPERKGNREQEVSAIARGLKNLAKELKVPVIALSQLSRAVETRGGSKRPILSDMRDSGGIEEAADMVCFLYRPEYYGIMEDEHGTSLKGVAELIFAKHRHGALNTILLKFTDKFTRFSDYSSNDEWAMPPAPPVKQLPLPKPGLSVDTDGWQPEAEDIPF